MGYGRIIHYRFSSLFSALKYSLCHCVEFKLLNVFKPRPCGLPLSLMYCMSMIVGLSHELRIIMLYLKLLLDAYY